MSKVQALYQDVIQAIRDGVDAEDVETMIDDETAAITDVQKDDLRSELARREAEAQS